MKTLDWSVETLGLDYNSTGLYTKLNHIIKIAKKKYYEEQLINYKHNTKLLWKTLNEIMNRHKNNNMLPKEFNGNSPGEIISNPYTIANKFNDYFVNVGPGIARNIPNSKREPLMNTYLTAIRIAFFLKRLLNMK
jgi:hypothetical protein